MKQTRPAEAAVDARAVDTQFSLTDQIVLAVYSTNYCLWEK